MELCLACMLSMMDKPVSDFDSYTWTQGHSFRRLMLIIVAFYYECMENTIHIMMFYYICTALRASRF